MSAQSLATPAQRPLHAPDEIHAPDETAAFARLRRICDTRIPRPRQQTFGQSDPAELHDYARKLGNLAAVGVIDFEQALSWACIRALRLGAACLSISDLRELEHRLITTVITAVESLDLSTSSAIRDSVRPLIASRASREQILLAAHRANRSILPVRLVEEIAREEVTNHVRRVKERQRVG